MSRLYAYEKRAHKRMKRIHKKEQITYKNLRIPFLRFLYILLFLTDKKTEYPDKFGFSGLWGAFQ
jgi:hypothetical protein